MWNELLHRRLFNNDLIAYAVAAAMFLAGILLIWVFNFFVLRYAQRWASRTQTMADDFLVESLQKMLSPLLYYGAFYLSVRSLALNPAVAKLITFFGVLLLTITAVRFILQAIRFGIFQVWIPGRADAAHLDRQMKALMPILAGVLWAMGLVFLLDNLGFKISAIVAGLGIGGVAVALAAQAVLADLFSYFAIMFDKPFEIDDFIIVGGDFMGTVEHIGIKTTRIRSLGGEQLVFANKDLTDSRVRNYKRMQLRRVVFKLGVTYDTPTEKLKKATAMIRDIITQTPDTRFDRAHFASYGDFNLVIEVVYYVLSADYNKYMDVQQILNLAIKDAFAREKIEFAFPTQTIHMQPAP
jgi:small-conductance mechanosensitive channel